MTPDQELIDVIQGLLDAAKSGQLRGIAYVTLKDPHSFGTGWHRAQDTNGHFLLAGSSVLHMRLARNNLEPEEDGWGEKVSRTSVN